MPTTQSQWTAMISPYSSASTHGVRGFPLISVSDSPAFIAVFCSTLMVGELAQQT